jgi:hypothetical protein
LALFGPLWAGSLTPTCRCQLSRRLRPDVRSDRDRMRDQLSA